jgi:hypothetical protein
LLNHYFLPGLSRLGGSLFGSVYYGIRSNNFARAFNELPEHVIFSGTRDEAVQ